jgi:hypothetical protein
MHPQQQNHRARQSWILPLKRHVKIWKTVVPPMDYGYQ